MFNQECCNRRQNGCGRQITEQVIEPTITKCVQKDFHHQVPHICPIHTHVINRHIYNHTYTPRYTCSEENQIIHNDCGNNYQGFMN